MKKTYTVIPLILLVISILASMFLVLFTTPFVHCSYVLAVRKQVNPKTYTNLMKLDEKVYAVSPNESTFEVLRSGYSLSALITNYLSVGAEIPDEYLKGAIKTKRTELEKAKNGEKNIGIGPYQQFNVYAVYYPFSQESYVINVWTEYAAFLYLKGEKEKALSEIDNAIMYYQKNQDDIPVGLLFTQPIYTVYAFSETDEERNEIIQREKEITAIAKKSGRLAEEYMQKDNIFTNPDLDSLVKGDY